jgi:hypothetical protein
MVYLLLDLKQITTLNLLFFQSIIKENIYQVFYI